MEKRETFAYSCEFYSRILALSSGLKERRRLFDEFQAGFKPADDRFDPVELLNILEEAVNARHGWKRILARCSPEKPRFPSRV